MTAGLPVRTPSANSVPTVPTADLPTAAGLAAVKTAANSQMMASVTTAVLAQNSKSVVSPPIALTVANDEKERKCGVIVQAAKRLSTRATTAASIATADTAMMEARQLYIMSVHWVPTALTALVVQ